MAYRRSAFETVKGFEEIDHIASGDDELLMQKMNKAFPGNSNFAKCRGAIVRTNTLDSWKNVKAQKT